MSISGAGQRAGGTLALRGSYSGAYIYHLQRRLEQLTREAEELNATDAKLPLKQRTHIGILMAMRPWELSVFQAMRREPQSAITGCAPGSTG